MSTSYTATGLPRTFAWTRRAQNLIGKYVDAFCAWRIRQSLRERLDDLSDRELKDIGIARGEIDYLCKTALTTDPRLPE